MTLAGAVLARGAVAPEIRGNERAAAVVGPPNAVCLSIEEAGGHARN
jgi:hypothetical protein